jgi:enamine deaminase RidA (YjgF/YER057c/UK114 family)
VNVGTFTHAAHAEYIVTATLPEGGSPGDLFARCAEVLTERDARVVSQDVFGIERDDALSFELGRTFGGCSWPVTWLTEDTDKGLAGVQLWAVSGKVPTPIWVDGSLVGSVFEDADWRYCRLSGVLPNNLSEPKENQARAVFNKMDVALGAIGMDYGHVVRTWFYNDDILSWYGAFNEVRSDFYREQNVFNHLVPASTGVGGKNTAGAALVGGLLAVEPAHPDTQVSAIPSPLQCPALNYGSSFSRAVELVSPTCRRVYVSGTASIGPDGTTEGIGDVSGQIERTIGVVAAILESRGMNWTDVIRGLAYFKNESDSAAYARYCESNQVADMPVLVVRNRICRDDLLFEIEVDAVQTRKA